MADLILTLAVMVVTVAIAALAVLGVVFCFFALRREFFNADGSWRSRSDR